MGYTAAIALSAFGAGSQATGSFLRGRAERRLAEYNAGQIEAEGELAARDALTRGAEQETIVRRSIRGLIGEQRAAYAGQGVVVGTGSAAAVQADTARIAETDILTLRHNAAREAWGYRRRARAQARSLRTQGRYAASQGASEALSTIVGTGGTLLLDRYGFGRVTS